MIPREVSEDAGNLDNTIVGTNKWKYSSAMHALSEMLKILERQSSHYCRRD